MLILFTFKRKGILLIPSGTVSSDGLTYQFVAEGYLHELNRTIHVGPLNLEIILETGGKNGKLIGLFPDTVVTEVPWGTH